MRKLTSWRGGVVLAALLLATSGISARAVAPAPVVLANSIKPVAPQASTNGMHHAYISSGTLTAEQSAAPMKFEVSLKMRNLAELQERVARGERISAKEMAQKYEPLASDYQAAVDWARSKGLTITREDDHHMVLFLTGTVSQVSQALQVSFARVRSEGKEYTSAITAPSVPATISGALLGINGLQPHLRRHKHILWRSQARPDSLGGGATYRPSQIASAYNVNGLYTSNITGSGQTIAIVIDTFPASSDLVAFWKATGINQSLSNIQFVQAVAGTLPDPSGEETLDVEWSSAMAPGAKVRVYAATDLANADLDASYQQVLDDVTNHPEYNIHQMSMSYGEGETDITNSQLDTDAQFFAELAAQGVTCFASSGDEGSTPNDSTGSTNGPLQVENPASDPSVTGVGGTSLVLNSNNAVTSETVWNDTSGISGGGVSIHFARPSWQTGTGVNTSGMREVPDIACTADPVYGAYIYLQGQAQTVGGTSWASPTCAAFCALINEVRTAAGLPLLGVFGANLYSQIGTSNLRDITSGNNITARSGGKYVATTGYDECTGVGVPLVQPLAETLANTTSLVGFQNPAASQTVFPGSNASFTVTVSGGSPTYQWQIMPVGSSSWSNLGNNSTYSGVTGPTLTISNTTTAMSGDEFQCVVQVNSSTMTTTPSVLIVDQPLVVSTLAGRVGSTGLANGTGTSAEFDYPSGIAIDSSGNLYIADYANNQIRKITPSGQVTTPFGSTSGTAGNANGAGNNALFNSPNSVAADSSNNLYVADSGNNIIRKIVGVTVSTLAGTANHFSSPEGVAVDSSGNVYVADTGNDTIRKITPGGTVSILAGQTGDAGYADGGATSQALFNAPEAVAVDGSGNVYVADFGNSVVREISGGTVTTIAGKAGQAGYADGLAANALFNAPTGLAFDASGNLYITDSLVPESGSNAAGNCVLRKLSPAGVVSTVAGNPGVSGSSNGTGTAAEFYSLQAVACDPSGLIYMADTYNQTIRVGSVSGSPTMARATVTLGNLSVTYNGSPQSATATTDPSGLAVTFTYNGSSTPPTDAGTYIVIGTIDDPDYFGNAAGTMVISKAPATVTFNNLAATYDGSPQPVTVTTSPEDLGVNITYNGSTTAPTAVGSYRVVATVSDANYSDVATGTLVIGKAAATVTLGNLSDTYDDKAQAATVTTSPAGLPVTYTYNGKTTVPVNAGTYTVVATVNSPDATGSATGTLTINPEPATVTLTPGSLAAVYSGTAHAAKATTVPANLALTYTYNGIATAPVNVGSYAVVATVNNVNYTGGTDGTLVISPVAPLATTEAASAVGANTATLDASINPKGSSTTVQFQYGTSTAYGTTTGTQTVPAGTAAVAVTQSIGSLAPQTVYHYRVVAGNGVETVDGADKTFTTLAQPVFGENAAAYLGASGAEVSEGVNPGGVATSVYFQYGTTTSYGSQTALQSIGSGKTAVTVYALFPGLEASTVYYYRLVTVSAAGTFYGPQETFTTLGFDTTLVAYKGESAAGVTGGTFATLGNPAVNMNDDVAFAGTLTLATGVTAANDMGIWADDNTQTLRLIAQLGAVAHGTNNATFLTLSDPVYNNNEAVAFRGTLKVVAGEATATTATGIWSTSSGSLALVAQQGSQAPGCPAGATFATFTSLGLSDSNVNGAVIYATLNASTAAQVTAANNAGIWEGNTTADLHLVLRLGGIVDGKTISKLTFLPAETYVNGQTRSFNSTSGDIVCGATFSDKTTGLVTVESGTPAIAVVSGSQAPEVTNGVTNGAFASFGNPSINTNDNIAFAATMTVGDGGVTAATDTGIWAEDSGGNPHLIARSGTGAAPGTTANFLTFSDPVYNNNEKVAFRATLKVATGQATTTTATGIWCNSSGSLALVARQGGAAPGCPTGATFSGFTELALPDQGGATNNGGVVMLATLNANAAAAVTAANDLGIWAVDTTGALQLIVRTGDVLNGKTVTGLAFLPALSYVNGQSRSFAQENGDLAYLATFSDKSTAIVNVVFQ